MDIELLATKIERRSNPTVAYCSLVSGIAANLFPRQGIAAWVHQAATHKVKVQSLRFSGVGSGIDSDGERVTILGTRFEDGSEFESVYPESRRVGESIENGILVQFDCPPIPENECFWIRSQSSATPTTVTAVVEFLIASPTLYPGFECHDSRSETEEWTELSHLQGLWIPIQLPDSGDAVGAMRLVCPAGSNRFVSELFFSGPVRVVPNQVLIRELLCGESIPASEEVLNQHRERAEIARIVKIT